MTKRGVGRLIRQAYGAAWATGETEPATLNAALTNVGLDDPWGTPGTSANDAILTAWTERVPPSRLTWWLLRRGWAAFGDLRKLESETGIPVFPRFSLRGFEFGASGASIDVDGVTVLPDASAVLASHWAADEDPEEFQAADGSLHRPPEGAVQLLVDGAPVCEFEFPDDLQDRRDELATGRIFFRFAGDQLEAGELWLSA